MSHIIEQRGVVFWDTFSEVNEIILFGQEINIGLRRTNVIGVGALARDAEFTMTAIQARFEHEDEAEEHLPSSITIHLEADDKPQIEVPFVLVLNEWFYLSAPLHFTNDIGVRFNRFMGSPFMKGIRLYIAGIQKSKINQEK